MGGMALGIIYLDNAATSYPKPECVYRAVDDFNRQMGGNPGGASRKTMTSNSILLDTGGSGILVQYS